MESLTTAAIPDVHVGTYLTCGLACNLPPLRVTITLVLSTVFLLLISLLLKSACGWSAGHLVSGYVKQHLPIMLVNHLSMEADASKALTKGTVACVLSPLLLQHT